MNKGVDTYHGNSDSPKQLIDWTKVFDAGYDHVWIKATQGNHFKDPKFDRDRAEIEKIPFLTVGFYMWPDILSPVEEQADFFLDVVKTFKPNQGAMIDIETSPIIPNKDNLTIAKRIEAKASVWTQGYVGVFYNGGSMWKDTEFFNGYRPRILPAYTTEAHMRQLAGPFSPTVWQHSSKAQVPGVVGNVDEDYIFVVEMLQRSCIHSVVIPPISQKDEDTMQFNYNGVMTNWDGFKIRHIESTPVAELGQPVTIDRDHMTALLKETGVQRANASPFNIAGFEDPELHSLWG